METLNNGTIKIEVDPDRGGVITHFSGTLDRSVFRDTAIHGVFDDLTECCPILSLYGDPFCDPATGTYPWNPNQSNSTSFSSGPPSNLSGKARLNAVTNDDTTIYTNVTPVAFGIVFSEDENEHVNTAVNAGELLEDVVFEQWVTLEGNILSLRQKCTYTGPDRSTNWPLWLPMSWDGWDQEAPAIGIGDFTLRNIKGYYGGSPWTGGELTTSEVIGIMVNGGLNPYDTTEKWIALVDDDDWGVGVYAPYCNVFNVGDRATGGLLITPVAAFNMTTGAVLDFTVKLTLGQIGDIRSTFQALQPTGFHPRRIAGKRIHGATIKTN